MNFLKDFFGVVDIWTRSIVCKGSSSVDGGSAIVSNIEQTRIGKLLCKSLSNCQHSSISGVDYEKNISCRNACNDESSGDRDVDKTAAVGLGQDDGGAAAAQIHSAGSEIGRHVVWTYWTCLTDCEI